MSLAVQTAQEFNSHGSGSQVKSGLRIIPKKVMKLILNQFFHYFIFCSELRLKIIDKKICFELSNENGI